ncbi:MAG TPA: methylmalonyl-CoA mutase family protein [Nocardioides sp.]|uniref:methylmalonyl-CoA mutase family protein n=1 Tax=Nocardioides sp. TaxID=35761 RepID=UPI002CCA71B4|nr:methylmalonyl-CoA mutase family protein [Nocardioides sp.]HQR27993.1 methylmalonyl-CoA mutase family protein [Nocardioides sp.]
MTVASPGEQSGHLALQSDADRHDVTEWERAAAAVLRKAHRLGESDPDALAWKKLGRTTLDGIEVPPLGVPRMLAELTTAGRPSRSGDWDVRVRVTGADGSEAALADLGSGATSLWLALEEGTDPAGLLDGVPLDRTPVVLDVAGDPLPAARALAALVDRLGVVPAAGTNLGGDPLGAAVRGRAGADVEVLPTLAELARAAGVRAAVVDATAVHDLGASDAQELGYSMAVGAEYLRILAAAGMPVAEAAGLLEFRYAATDEQFLTIAKLRAARRLWARVLELSGVGERGQRQHAVTSRPMMSKYDPYVNMLRTTVAAFAAGVGGADAVTVLPFDTPLGRPDAFGRRIAKNTSALLLAESHVGAVADPAGGSFSVERLTDDLARAGWAELGRVEEAGGVRAALADGSLRGRVEEVVAVREREVATRRRPLTGLSEFPDLGEELPVREPAGGGDEVRRYGASFEALRDDPVEQRVFLATMGSVAKHTARATFATNLLAAGGIAVDVAGATKGVDGVLAAYAGQPVVCLAGTDPAYAEWGAPLVAALRGAGARRVVLAGKPGPTTVEGVDDSCALGLDALAFLTRTRQALRSHRTERLEGEAQA